MFLAAITDKSSIETHRPEPPLGRRACPAWTVTIDRRCTRARAQRSSVWACFTTKSLFSGSCRSPPPCLLTRALAFDDGPPHPTMGSVRISSRMRPRRLDRVRVPGRHEMGGKGHAGAITLPTPLPVFERQALDFSCSQPTARRRPRKPRGTRGGRSRRRTRWGDFNLIRRGLAPQPRGRPNGRRHDRGGHSLRSRGCPSPPLIRTTHSPSPSVYGATK